MKSCDICGNEANYKSYCGSHVGIDEFLENCKKLYACEHPEKDTRPITLYYYPHGKCTPIEALNISCEKCEKGYFERLPKKYVVE